MIGLDVGERAIGVAVSDQEGIVAQPLTTLKRTSRDDCTVRIADLVREWEAGGVIIGLPLTLSGEAGTQSRLVREYGERLASRRGLRVEYQDERLSSAEADRVLGEVDTSQSRRREASHRVAAALILQTWLHRQSTRSTSDEVK